MELNEINIFENRPKEEKNKKKKKNIAFCFIEWKNIDFNVNFIRLENVI